jgi:hypothetical protein
MHFRRPFFAAAAVCALAMASACATTGAGTVTHALMVDTDKALIVAGDCYHVAEQMALVGTPSMTPAQRATVGRLNDKASAALHTAYSVRSSAAIALAVDERTE